LTEKQLAIKSQRILARQNKITEPVLFLAIYLIR